jgi:arginine repressor
MIEHYYKHALDYAIVEILDKKSSLRYYELEEELSLYHKPSTSTLSRHLERLIRRRILRRIRKDNGNTFYSLSDLFKGSLDKQKKDNSTNYLEKTLSLPEFYYRLHSPFGLEEIPAVIYRVDENGQITEY